MKSIFIYLVVFFFIGVGVVWGAEERLESTKIMSEIIMTRSDLYGLVKSCEKKEELEAKLNSLIEQYNAAKAKEDKTSKTVEPAKPPASVK